jgi:hypothetical protein
MDASNIYFFIHQNIDSVGKVHEDFGQLRFGQASATAGTWTFKVFDKAEENCNLTEALKASITLGNNCLLFAHDANKLPKDAFEQAKQLKSEYGCDVLVYLWEKKALPSDHSPLCSIIEKIQVCMEEGKLKFKDKSFNALFHAKAKCLISKYEAEVMPILVASPISNLIFSENTIPKSWSGYPKIISYHNSPFPPLARRPQHIYRCFFKGERALVINPSIGLPPSPTYRPVTPPGPEKGSCAYWCVIS